MHRWKKSAVLMVAFALLLAFATSAWAKERLTWRFDKGHFENTAGNKWVEKIGDDTVRWTEIRRTDDFIELTREVDGRDHFVRLFDDHASRKIGKNGEWEKVWNGKWDR